MSPDRRPDSPLAIRSLDQAYDPKDSEASALDLVYALQPEWRHSEGPVTFVRFTDGITNTLLKAEKWRPGRSQNQVDEDAILLRAYGQGTDILIDREREIRAHSLLASQGLAPTLLARFDNGLLYRFIPGHVCTAEDLRDPEIYRKVAEKLGQWHAALPIDAISNSDDFKTLQDNSHVPFPNLWSVTQSWIEALPTKSEEQRKQVEDIQAEFDDLKQQLSGTSGLYGRDYIFSHCDLLCGNVIVQPGSVSNGSTNGSSNKKEISFIDYEYATPAPAVFDIANHFAEWGGFECDYNVMPCKSQRREFLTSYVESYHQHMPLDKGTKRLSTSAAVDHLYQEVDRYRGVPGFYWGVWALVQAQISQIDFDYGAYAKLRFSEYYAWQAETNGSRQGQGEQIPLRESRWAEE